MSETNSKSRLHRLAVQRGYTHVVRFVKLDTPAGMGPVPCSFPTTADAVDRHLESLFAQALRGLVTCVEAVRIAESE